MEFVWSVIIRSVIAVLFLLLLARVEGVRLISQLTFYDYIVGISIGSIAATMCVDLDIPMINSLIGMVIFILIPMGIAFLTNKSIWARRIFTGSTKVIIDNGKIIQKNLMKARFDLNDLMRELRFQGYFDISDIKYALLETNGKISILPKVMKRPVTIEDLNLAARDSGLVANVIIDGKFMKNNIKAINMSEREIETRISELGLKNEEILLATVDMHGEIRAFKKNIESNASTIFE